MRHNCHYDTCNRKPLMLVLYLLILPCKIFSELYVDIGNKSGAEDDDKSLAECLEEAVLVNCEIILGHKTLKHDGVKIKDGNCAAYKGKKLADVPIDEQYVQVSLSLDPLE